MISGHRNIRKQKAFTIVELAVVIAVIGILAAISVVGYNGWRERTESNSVQSDLKQVAAAMESARNFGSGYPTSLPSTFTASQNVTITYYSGDDKIFCIDGVSNVIPTVAYFLNSTDYKDPVKGTCEGGPGAIPVQTGWLAVSSRGDNSCGIRAEKSVYCWGNNTYGQLGNNSTTTSRIPTAVDTSGVLAGKTIKTIALGGSSACAIASDNQAYCWGGNTYGQLGNNSTTNSSTPVPVDTSGVLAGKTMKVLVGGDFHICGIASNGQVYCWGEGTSGQLGNNIATTSSVPVPVDTSGVLAGKTIKSLGVGRDHTCAIASDNQAYCWGSNIGRGQLGNSATAGLTVPAPVAVDTSGVLAGKTIKMVAAGSKLTCAIASDNQAYCWGDNTYGKLGNNSTVVNSVIPVAVDTSGVLAGKTIKSLGVSRDHTCAIASDNQAYCWGDNTYGKLGNNSTTNSSTPVPVDTSGVLAGKTIKSLGVGRDHTCAIASDNEAYCWGRGIYGQLGRNSTSNSSVPVRVTL